MNKRICFFIGTMNLGGIGKLSLYLIDYFLRRGVIVDLFLLKEGGEYFSQLPKDVNIHIAKGSSISKIFQFISYLVRNKPDYSFSTRERQNVINIIACIFTGLKVKPIISIHSIDPFESNSYENKILTNVASILYKIPRKIIVVSAVVGKEFSKRYKLPSSAYKVIYNPSYDPNSLKGCTSEPENGKEKYLINIGRLNEIKDIPTLLKAFKIFNAKNMDYKLYIVGDGVLKPQLEALARELDIDKSVVFFGYLEKPMALLKHSKCLVVSSRSEGFGNVIVEALGAGIQVVSTDCGGPREILDDGKYGQLVDVGDFLGMAEAMSFAIQNPIQKDTLLERAKSYSVDTICNVYYNYIFSL